MLCTLKVISDLHHAIRVSDIDLHYRPLICLHSGELAGFEALLRWHPGTLMRVSPDAFIEIAERNGLIQQLGTWMLHRAARDWETLRPYCQPQQLAGLERPPFLSLNFSAPELARLGLADILNWCLAERQIPPAELSLELPERLIPVRQHQAPPTFDLAHAMEQVRRLGINLVLDDMGTGSAGLGALQEFPFSSVKIERQFVRQICDHPRSHRVVAAMLNLARSLDMHAMAEGVDNAETHAALKAMGCDYAQGDHYARPCGARTPLPGPGVTAIPPPGNPCTIRYLQHHGVTDRVKQGCNPGYAVHFSCFGEKCDEISSLAGRSAGRPGGNAGWAPARCRSGTGCGTAALGQGYAQHQPV